MAEKMTDTNTFVEMLTRQGTNFECDFRFVPKKVSLRTDNSLIEFLFDHNDEFIKIRVFIHDEIHREQYVK
ncbi:MAG: hypothetical protein WC107_05810 [Patescibacteria group bacterium]